MGDADFQVIHRPAVPLEARDAYDRQESAVSDGIETGVEVAADVDLVHYLTVECPVHRIGIVFQVEPVAVTAPELILDFLLGSIDPGR